MTEEVVLWEFFVLLTVLFTAAVAWSSGLSGLKFLRAERCISLPAVQKGEF